MLHTIARKILKSSYFWLLENLGCYSPPPLQESCPRDLGVTILGEKLEGFNYGGWLLLDVQHALVHHDLAMELLNEGL
jgi:hypothetical protein